MKITFTQERRCPHCHSTDFLQRTRRPVVFKLLFFVKSKAYECFACSTKFVRVGEATPRPVTR